MEQKLFSETQRFTQVWIWFIVLIVVVASWYSFLVQIVGGQKFGTNPAPDIVVWIIFLLFGLGFPVLFLMIRMITTVDRETLEIAFRPLHRREIKLIEIKSAIAKQYRPVMEYGGWGVRWQPGGNRAYNVKGNMGVLVILLDGRQVMIGSQQAEALARAIESAMGLG